MKVLIRADGSFERGLGHISKQMTLAKELKRLNHEVMFVTRKNGTVAKLLSRNDLIFMQIDGDTLASIDESIESFKPDLLILDIMKTSIEYIRSLKKHNIKIVTFDNTDVSAYDCDMIFNVMYYHPDDIKRQMMHHALYEGFKYVIIAESYQFVEASVNREVERILLTQGGADTTNKTPFLMDALYCLRSEIGKRFVVDVVIGPAFKEEAIEEIEHIASQKPVFRMHRNPGNLADLIGRCDIAITAGGTTMWEIATCKRPMYIMINEAFEDETAQLIRLLGFALYDGYLPERKTVKNSLGKLITDGKLRKEMIRQMSEYDIGNGMNRIIDEMYERGVLH